MNTLLLNGPISDPTQPSLAVPALAAYLKMEGFCVTTGDVSIEAFNMLISESFLQKAIRRIESRSIPQGDIKFIKEFQKRSSVALSIAPVTLERIKTAKATFTDSKKFYEYNNYKNAMCSLQSAFDIINAAYFPTEIGLTKYELSKEQTVSNILQHIKDSESNVFIEYFKTVTIPKVELLNPDIIGLSITYLSQFLPSLTLCRLLKLAFPETPVILGGAFLTAISDRFAQLSFLWDMVTGIVIYEGESALAEICRHVQESKDLSGIPNLLLKGDCIPSSDRIYIEDIKRLPPPDFSGIPLDLYLVPEPVLPLQSCRGCYWGRCTFCSVSRATRSSYRQRPIELFLKDLDTLHALYGANVFFICDDATPTNYMKNLAKYIHTRKLPYYWGTEARFERQLDENTCQRLVEGGCLHIIFGFESASTRILSLMQKGTNISTTKDILKACKKANIGVNLQSFLGFPGETKEEANCTEDFFCDNKDLYTSLGLGHFKAVEGCKVVLQPEQFGVAIKGKSREIIVPWYEIETDQGMSPKESFHRFIEMMDGLLNDDIVGPGLIHGSSAAHGLLYLRRFGRNYVDSLGGDSYVWKGDVNEDICKIRSDVELYPIDEFEWIVYKSAGCSSIVPQNVAHAIQLLQVHPQSITSVASNIVREDILSDPKKLELFSEIVFHLINLARIGILNYSLNRAEIVDHTNNP